MTIDSGIMGAGYDISFGATISFGVWSGEPEFHT